MMYRSDYNMFRIEKLGKTIMNISVLDLGFA